MTAVLIAIVVQIVFRIAGVVALPMGWSVELGSAAVGGGPVIAQAFAGRGEIANARSQVNRYDNLNRLVQTDVGEVDFDSPGGPSLANRERTDSWQLDLLGNWAGGAAVGTTGPPTIPGINPQDLPADWGRLSIDWAAGSGATPPWSARTDEANPQNQITELSTTTSASGGTVAPQVMKYDGAGNLTFDGTYAYQYDAWNRLVQVNAAQLTGGGEVTLGALVKQHCYDGVGRVTRTRSPLKVGSGPPLAGDDAAGLPRTFREERFYYDGIRRIQEVVVDTLAGTNGTNAAAPVSRLSREYVWGPGGVDELLAQFAGAAAGTSTDVAAGIQARPWFALLDGGGDVVALVEVPPATPLDPVPQGRVAGQWTYDAYGAVTSAETLTLQAFPALHAGHKGLFVDRLDVPVAQTSGDGTAIDAELPRLARAGVTPQVAQRIMRHSDYRTTLKHYTVLGLTDTAAAMDRLPGIAPERQSDAATGTTDTAPDTCTNGPQLFCQQLGRETGQNRAASRGELTRGGDRRINEKPQRMPGFMRDSAEFPIKAGEGTRRARHQAICRRGLSTAGKKARRCGATLIFVDEAGLSTKKSRATTWGAVGKTPVL